MYCVADRALSLLWQSAEGSQECPKLQRIFEIIIITDPVSPCCSGLFCRSTRAKRAQSTAAFDCGDVHGEALNVVVVQSTSSPFSRSTSDVTAPALSVWFPTVCSDVLQGKGRAGILRSSVPKLRPSKSSFNFCKTLPAPNDLHGLQSFRNTS